MVINHWRQRPSSNVKLDITTFIVDLQTHKMFTPSSVNKYFFPLKQVFPASGSCSWDCTPIKECKVIYRDLVAAKIAREKQENWKVEKIIRWELELSHHWESFYFLLSSLIRGYTCDQKAEQVCCPEFMGQFNNTLTNTVNMVYAINSDTIVIRSSMEHSSWSNTETFFWREKSCFPSLGLFSFLHF